MRSRSMQSLTDAIKRRHPGVVIYGKGDAAHALRTSDHNEDDTSGSRPAQTDADSNPEHRAIDVMLGSAFSKADAYALIDDLLQPVSRARLFYILFNGWRWSRSTSWAKVEFDGDPHNDHIHISGWAADDENAAAWTAVEGGDMSALAESQISNVYKAEFYGGPSCGRKVPTAAGESNSNVAKFDYSLTLLETILTVVKGEDDTATIVAAIRAEGDKTRAGLSDLVPAIVAGLVAEGIDVDIDTVEAALRRVLGGVDGASPPAQG